MKKLVLVLAMSFVVSSLGIGIAFASCHSNCESQLQTCDQGCQYIKDDAKRLRCQNGCLSGYFHCLRRCDDRSEATGLNFAEGYPGGVSTLEGVQPVLCVSFAGLSEDTQGLLRDIAASQGEERKDLIEFLSEVEPSLQLAGKTYHCASGWHECITHFCNNVGLYCCPKGYPYLSHCDCLCYNASPDCNSYSRCNQPANP